MLLIPTRLLPSKIHGLGVFAAVNIKKGDKVWEYREPSDHCVSFAEYDNITDEMRKFIDHFGYIPHGKKYHVICGDISGFINHSKECNFINSDNYTLKENEHSEISIAARGIEAGEEITVNCYEFCENPNSGGNVY